MKDLKKVERFICEMIELFEKNKIEIDLDNCDLFFEGQFIGTLENNVEKYDIVVGEDIVLSVDKK